MIAVLAMVPGCMRDTGEGVVSRFMGMEPTALAPRDSTATPASAELEEVSPIIAQLQARRSAIASGTPYERVAEAVMQSDARVAEAELRVAQLRAQAARKNWLPRIGPDISLNSLGGFAASLVIDQVLFDNGRKIAERDKAKADVELAAVALVEDGNSRVFEALTLYLAAEEGRDSAAHFAEAHREMTRFEWVMSERVRGGVSDMSDLNVLRQKLASIQAQQGRAEERSRTALAELNAMSARPLDALRGLGGLHAAPEAPPLAVLRAEAEREATLAEARIARAGHLPGLSANGRLSDDGSLSGGLGVTTDSLFGLGTMAELNAIEAGKETAERRVAQAAEAAAREIASQSRQLEAYRRQLSEARLLTAQARQNLDLFQRQYEGGQRQVMDVVGVYETYAGALETEIDLRYRAARAELALARLQGALAEGARI
ncbi:TolC family protein [Salipiger abyssi]|uniref:TolC family protein n=1 Tax=Salipiger abyssi TaxID=1250539 RepID=UPI004059E0D8